MPMVDLERISTILSNYFNKYDRNELNLSQTKQEIKFDLSDEAISFKLNFFVE